MNFSGSFFKVLSVFYRFGKTRMAGAVSITLLGAVIDIAALFVLFSTVNGLFLGQSSIWLLFKTVQMQNAMLLTLLLFGVKLIYGLAQQRYILNFCYVVNQSVTAQIINGFYQQPTEVFRKNRLSEALNRVFTIGGYFSETIFLATLSFFYEGIMATTILVALAFYNFKILILLVIVLAPVLLLLISRSRKKLKAVSGRLNDDNAKYHQQVMTLLQGLLDIRLSGRFQYFYNQFEKRLKELNQTRKTIAIESGFQPRLMEFAAISSMVLLYILSQVLSQNVAIAGLVSAFATAAFRLIPSLNRILGSFQNLSLHRENIDLIYHLQPNPIYKPTPNSGQIEIQKLTLTNIDFNYDSYQVLKQVNLELYPGSVTSITGPSGTGKSTLVNIITGLLKASNGQILVNNQTLTPEIREALLHQSAYVMQSPYFMPGSVMENICFGLDLNQQQLEYCINAVKLENLKPTIQEVLSYDIGDDGSRLSGGQKQRLAIARALYRKAQILVLDEPTNSLDGITKQEIMNLVLSLTKTKNLITIVISHDNEVLKQCETVYELQNGVLMPH